MTAEKVPAFVIFDSLKLVCALCLQHSQGKILIIGGGIANFTNVAETFKGRQKQILVARCSCLSFITGIIRALTKYAPALIEHSTFCVVCDLQFFQPRDSRFAEVKTYVRRGGPNYQEGLERMRDLADKLDIPIKVYLRCCCLLHYSAVALVIAKVFGPESHMTSIVSMALGKPIKEFEPKYVPASRAPQRIGLSVS
jgi:ATP citrate (pro-S)-lyase